MKKTSWKLICIEPRSLATFSLFHWTSITYLFVICSIGFLSKLWISIICLFITIYCHVLVSTTIWEEEHKFWALSDPTPTPTTHLDASTLTQETQLIFHTFSNPPHKKMSSNFLNEIIDTSGGFEKREVVSRDTTKYRFDEG